MTKVVRMKVGRPLLTDEEKTKVRNIALRVDVIEALHALSDRLVPELGFRPTLTQTVSYLIKKVQPNA